jgi:hypothetical protein
VCKQPRLTMCTSDGKPTSSGMMGATPRLKRSSRSSPCRRYQGWLIQPSAFWRRIRNFGSCAVARSSASAVI